MHNFESKQGGISPEVYKGTRSLTVQSFVEANVKNGTQFEGSTLLPTVGAGADNDTIFLTGAMPVILKTRRVGYSGRGLTASVYEAPTYTGGTSVPYQNANALNPVVGESSIIVGSTVTADGVLIFAPVHALGNSSNQGKGDVISTLDVEHILTPNTAYLLRLTSLDTQVQDISSHISWYEGPLS